MVSRRLVSRGELISPEKLISLYIKFQEEEQNPSRVKSNEIKAALNLIKVIKNADYDQGIRFKDRVFERGIHLNGIAFFFGGMSWYIFENTSGNRTPLISDPIDKEQVLRPRIRIFTNQAFTFRKNTDKEQAIVGMQCKLCLKTFTTEEELRDHIHSELHIFRNLFRRLPNTS